MKSVSNVRLDEVLPRFLVELVKVKGD